MAEKSYTKPALTVSQQLEFLITQGLHIEDQKLAIRALETVSYYRLSSYLLPFKQSTPHLNKFGSFINLTES